MFNITPYFKGFPREASLRWAPSQELLKQRNLFLKGVGVTWPKYHHYVMQRIISTGALGSGKLKIVWNERKLRHLEMLLWMLMLAAASKRDFSPRGSKFKVRSSIKAILNWLIKEMTQSQQHSPDWEWMQPVYLIVSPKHHRHQETFHAPVPAFSNFITIYSSSEMWEFSINNVCRLSQVNLVVMWKFNQNKETLHHGSQSL